MTYNPIPSYFNNSLLMDTHRQAPDTMNFTRMRLIAFNNSSGLISDWIYSSNFNLTNIVTNVSQWSIPNGTVSTNAVTFYCNYTNRTKSVEAADAQVLVDGTLHNATFNQTSLIYHYTNDNTWYGGPHYWKCVMSKADYKSYNGTNTSVNLTGFGIFLPDGRTNVSMTCPFPTIYGMTPAGQKALIGILRIQNYNSTARKNYSLILNDALPTGITVYARSGRYVAGAPTTGWTALSPSSWYTNVLTNVNSTNSSAYIWLRLDCVSAAPSTTIPFDYVVQEN